MRTEPFDRTVTWQLGDWTYTPELRELRRGEQVQRLKPLLDRLLQRLLQAPGAVVSRDQLIEDVWTRRLVNDEVLSRAIAELRAALGDDAREPRYIETLAKGGYRWIASASASAAGGDAATTTASMTAPTTSVEDTGSTVAASGAIEVRTPAGRTWRISLLAIIALLLAGALWLGLRDDESSAVGSVDLLTARPLTADPRLDFEPRFDAAGRVVYIRLDNDSGQRELVLVDRRGQSERVLFSTSRSLRHPAPSPDLTEVAVLHWPGQHCELWLISAIDDRRRRLTDCADRPAGSLQWIEDGAALLFTAPAVDPQVNAPGLARVDRRTGEVRRLTTPTLAGGAELDPRLSPDGRTLVFASLQPGERRLWSSPWPALDPRRALFERAEPIHGFAFEGVDDRLLIAGDLLLYRALHRLQPGGTPQLIGGRGAQSVDVASDGAVVWSESNYDGELWLGRAGEDGWQAVASSNRHEAQPAFSPDGRQLALVSNRSGTESIIHVELDRGDVRALPLDPTRRWVRPSWSADGRSLILTAYLGEHTQLFRFSLDGAVLTPLLPDEVDPFAGIELADRLLYRRGNEGAATLMQARIDGASHAHPTPIAVGNVGAFRASAGWLAFRAGGSATLQIAPLDRPDAAQALLDLDTPDSESFALADDWLYYASGGQLWRRQLPDGAPEPIATAHYPDAQRPSLAASSDGQLAIAELSTVQMDLMIAVPDAR